MKIRVVVEADIEFNHCQDTSELDSDIVGQSVVSGLNNSSVAGEIVETINERTGYYVTSLTLHTPEAECIDYQS